MNVTQLAGSYNAYGTYDIKFACPDLQSERFLTTVKVTVPSTGRDDYLAEHAFAYTPPADPQLDLVVPPATAQLGGDLVTLQLVNAAQAQSALVLFNERVATCAAKA